MALPARSAYAARPTVTGFVSAQATVPHGAPVRFSWTAGDADGDALTCTLDPTGIGPAIVLPSCGGAQTYDHLYTWPGTYQARLTVSDGTESAHGDHQQQVASTTTLSLRAPTAGTLVGSSLTVRAGLSTQANITQVTARVRDVQTALAYSATALCGQSIGCEGLIGTLDLSLLARGEQVLEVVAEDAGGARSYYVQRVELDDPPALTVTAPLDESAALPLLRTTAQCTDDAGPCTLSVRVSQPSSMQVLASGTGQLDQDVDLSAYPGSTVTLRITARDSRAQTTFVERIVYVDDGTRLMLLEEMPGPILDVADQRMLYRIAGSNGDRLFVFDRILRSTDEVPLPPGLVVDADRSFLAPFGAIVTADLQSDVSAPAHVYDWPGGFAVSDLGVANSQESLVVEGDYASWSNASTLYRRDLRTGTTITVSSSAGNWRNSIDADGTVTYWTGGPYRIERYDGATSVVAQDPQQMFAWVVSDGQRSVFRSSPACCNTYEIVAIVGAQAVVLRPASSDDAQPSLDYAVHADWIAYTRAGLLGQLHVWTYSPAGVHKQRTIAASSSRIDRVGFAGEVMLINSGQRFLSEADGDYGRVSSQDGTAYPLHDGWLLAQGRTLFRVNGTGIVFDDGFEAPR